MDAINCQWSSRWMDQSSVVGIFEQWQEQLETLTKKVDALESRSIQNAYYQNQASYTPNYYHPGWQNHPSFSWNNNQDQLFAPELSYPLEFSYQPQMYEVSHQPPPQIEEKSNLEEILTNYREQDERRQQEERESRLEKLLIDLVEQVETLTKSQEASIQNLENQMEQLINIANDPSQWTLPSDSEINPKSDGKEYCEVTLSSDEELCVTIGENFEGSHPDVEEDCVVENIWSEIGEEEKIDVDDHAKNSISVVQNPILPLVPFLHPFPNFGEYFRVEIGEDIDKTEELPSDFKECFCVEVVKGAVKDKADEESYFLPMDEDKFGGSQFCVDVRAYKEKTRRRHEKIIFAIEPD